MKILFMTDMECVSGITCAEYLDSSSARYQQTRASLTGDVNAAVEGCFAGGADEVFVKDGHGIPDNLILDELDPRAKLHPGSIDNWSGLDETFDATLLLGQHAKAGTLNAFLSHTQSSLSIFEHTINGVSLGETGQWALMAGNFDIPVLFLAGDDAGCAEAEALLPGIKTVSVGTGCGRQRMAPRNQKAVWEEITAGVEDAVKNAKKYDVKPYKLESPYTVRVTFKRTDQADQACRLRFDRIRIDGRTVEMTVKSPMEILSIFV